MGFSMKAKNTDNGSSSSNGNWGMSLLLVFFSADDSPILNGNNTKKYPFASSYRRTNSSHILARAQSTVSVCAIIVLVTLILFAISTFEIESAIPAASRRHLSQNPNNSPFSSSISALQGMGKLYLRGTRAMNELLVAHLVEDISEDEFRVFLRLLLRSGLTARGDVAFVFPSISLSSKLDDVIIEESDSFLKLLDRHVRFNTSSASWSFDRRPFMERGKTGKPKTEPIWGKRGRNTDGTGLSYGSVVGFDAAELDPVNSLAGFLGRVPMSFRRWACYPMLLGRVRRFYRNIMLVDAKGSLIVANPFRLVRNRSPDSVYLSTMPTAKKNSDKARSRRRFQPAVVMGGSRGIRRLTNAMLTEIVRSSLRQKGKNPATESALLSQLVRNELVSKGVNFIASSEPLPEASSLASLVSKASGLLSLPSSGYAVLQRGDSDYSEFSNSIIMKLICSSDVDYFLYKDCQQKKREVRRL